MSGKIPARMFFAVLVSALLLATRTAGAIEQPPPPGQGDKKPSFSIEPAAQMFVGKFDRTALLWDEVFLKGLEDLQDDDLAGKLENFTRTFFPPVLTTPSRQPLSCLPRRAAGSLSEVLQVAG